MGAATFKLTQLLRLARLRPLNTFHLFKGFTFSLFWGCSPLSFLSFHPTDVGKGSRIPFLFLLSKANSSFLSGEALPASSIILSWGKV